MSEDAQGMAGRTEHELPATDGGGAKIACDWVGNTVWDKHRLSPLGGDALAFDHYAQWAAYLAALAERPLPMLLVLSDPPPDGAAAFLEWFAQRGVMIGITSELARGLPSGASWMAGVRLLLTDGKKARVVGLAHRARLHWMGPGPAPIVPLGCHAEKVSDVSEALHQQRLRLRAQQAVDENEAQPTQHQPGEANPEADGRVPESGPAGGWRERLFRKGLAWAQKPVVGPVLRWGWALSQLTRTYHAMIRMRTQVESIESVQADIQWLQAELESLQGGGGLHSEPLPRCLRLPAPDQLATARASLNEEGLSPTPADFSSPEVRQFWLGQLGGAAGRAVVRQQYEHYRPHLLPLDGPLLDVGCGHGDWVAYLAEHGEVAIGIDSHAAIVERCRSRGLRAEHADVFDWLSEHVAEYAAITLMQVIEHIPRDRLAELLAALAAALRPGGQLLLETVNPAHPLALSMFYNDPTHERPLPTEYLGFLCQCAGLEPQDILYTYPLEVTVTAAQWQKMHYVNYALLLRKP